MPQGNEAPSLGLYPLEHAPTAVTRSDNAMENGRNRRGEAVGKVYDDVDTSEDEDGTASISGTDFGSLTSVE